MTLRRLPLVLIVLVVLGEVAVSLWAFAPVTISTDPVFTFPPAAANFGKCPKLAPAIELYGADRGAEWNHTAPDGTRLSVFYFEWDNWKLNHHAILEISNHSPEVCNTRIGFNLEKILPERAYQLPNQLPLVFDTTSFTDPAGRSVFIFKMNWIQGWGSLGFREHSSKRLQRLSNALHRHSGAVRVLQAGVFDAQNADHAWQTFRSQVLDQLKW